MGGCSVLSGLQKLQQPDDDDEQDELDDEAAAEAAAARLGRGGVQAHNDDVGRPGGGCDEEEEEAGEGEGEGKGGGGGGLGGVRSMRVPAPRFTMPKVRRDAAVCVGPLWVVVGYRTF